MLSGVLVWFFATMFFVLFGERVLFSPGTENFITSIILLVIGTGLLLWGVTYVYLLFDKSNNAPLKFGIIGTIIGLSLDTFSLSNHSLVFPKLDEPQVIAFTAWMSFAYALYLFIPAMINKQRIKHQKG
ncbi:MAG: DUF5367 family protein [Bacillaceae bacterium]|nr:DUF5367 family protein [Bacillaceae bacterium]